jgi:TRAP-type mannitol/chloroaromatic compound transport system permease small subunit
MVADDASRRAARNIADGIEGIVDVVGRTASWLTFVLALVMGANVLLRYGFSLGRIWAQELEWHLLVPIVLIGMSYALRHGEHVRVDVLFARFSRRGKFAVELVSALLAMGFALIVIRLSIPYVAQSWSIGEGSANPGGLDHRWIVKSLIPIGFALLFVQSLAQAIRAALALREP